MLCNNCSNKSFCKHYDFIVNAHTLTIKLEECDNHKAKHIVNKTIDKLATQTHISAPANINTGIPNTLLDRVPKVYHDLRKIADPYDNLTATYNTSTSKLATPVEISKAICDRCKKEVLSTEIDNCVECGRPVCRDCGVGALNNGKPELTCERCWSGTPDPDPNNPEEVKITYGEEKKEWDIEDFESKEDDVKVKEDKDESRKQVGAKPSIKKPKK